MRPRWAFVAAVVLLLPGALAITAVPPGRAVLKLAQSSNDLGFDLYRRLRQKPGNLVISPASLSTALSMAWGGARGETAEQMKKVLHLQGTPDEVMTASGELARALQEPSRPVVFHLANQLFGEKTYRLVPAFVEKTRKAFGAPIERLDFRKAPEPARVHINQWVESRTGHRVKDLIPPGGVAPNTGLVLVDAIYFLGDWEEPFPGLATRPAPFYLTPSKKRSVPTMNLLWGFRVARRDGLTALELPYKGGSFSMTLLVPDKIDGLAAVESSLDAKRLDALAAAMREEIVSLALPKFELSPAASLSLREDLRALGMPLAFDPRKADLTGIARPLTPENRLVLGDVFHKSFVRVDEKGTEAAGATAVEALVTGPPQEPLRVVVDRPFLFLIRDNASGVILFLGRVSDPGVR
jgi:serpin B